MSEKELKVGQKVFMEGEVREVKEEGLKVRLFDGNEDTYVFVSMDSVSLIPPQQSKPVEQKKDKPELPVKINTELFTTKSAKKTACTVNCLIDFLRAREGR